MATTKTDTKRPTVGCSKCDRACSGSDPKWSAWKCPIHGERVSADVDPFVGISNTEGE